MSGVICIFRMEKLSYFCFYNQALETNLSLLRNPQEELFAAKTAPQCNRAREMAKGTDGCATIFFCVLLEDADAMVKVRLERFISSS